jgi:hypothetical protein
MTTNKRTSVGESGGQTDVSVGRTQHHHERGRLLGRLLRVPLVNVSGDRLQCKRREDDRPGVNGGTLGMEPIDKLGHDAKVAAAAAAASHTPVQALVLLIVGDKVSAICDNDSDLQSYVKQGQFPSVIADIYLKDIVDDESVSGCQVAQSTAKGEPRRSHAFTNGSSYLRKATYRCKWWSNPISPKVINRPCGHAPQRPRLPFPR